MSVITMVHPLAQTLLVRIMQTAMDRMNTGADITPWEAWTLGRITAICTEYPGVVDAVAEAEDHDAPPPCGNPKCLHNCEVCVAYYDQQTEGETVSAGESPPAAGVRPELSKLAPHHAAQVMLDEKFADAMHGVHYSHTAADGFRFTVCYEDFYIEGKVIASGR